MAVIIEFGEGYQWVVAAAIANVLITSWMPAMVGLARKKYNVPYPTMYADEKENKHAQVFNCVQRAHQNTVEMTSNFLIALLIGGLQFPLVAAALGAAYNVARIQYFKGYSTGEASKRFSAGGFLFIPTYYALVVCAVCFALHLFFPNLL